MRTTDVCVISSNAQLLLKRKRKDIQKTVGMWFTSKWNAVIITFHGSFITAKVVILINYAALLSCYSCSFCSMCCEPYANYVYVLYTCMTYKMPKGCNINHNILRGIPQCNMLNPTPDTPLYHHCFLISSRSFIISEICKLTLQSVAFGALGVNEQNCILWKNIVAVATSFYLFMTNQASTRLLHTGSYQSLSKIVWI